MEFIDSTTNLQGRAALLFYSFVSLKDNYCFQQIIWKSHKVSTIILNNVNPQIISTF